eukprot:CAMPEP_0118855094 /NCGR_PEP_ID=MMETSP1163-20130328/3052_1 /TAXON_ID=124430 /ORGANISM="Phaeomonas parva, Strain CCMP2877" /LENGTH=323 /DNA_ID=CAMNT_0006787925 /DNA_START=136 /DNA_END=1107 /DNA_ORIENTATION=-
MIAAVVMTARPFRAAKAKGVARANRCRAVAWRRHAAWTADGRSQQDFMESDLCVVVDEADQPLEAQSKKACHTINLQQPRGVLHRAFSVFLFDDAGRLLLQQRAGDKITFPNVWTNTCCSHQLEDMTPREVDTEPEVLSGSIPGSRNAATRKLRHELGIETPAPLDFRFVTRLHYWAIDTKTHGVDSPWGEHEVDYILLARVPEGGLDVEPNLEEVQAVRYVTPADLEGMLADEANLWSPWFRIVATDPRFLPRWWESLDALVPRAGEAPAGEAPAGEAPAGEAPAAGPGFDLEAEHAKIYRMDPDAAFQGKAGPWLNERQKA